eukprot:TRINITY_DN40685_c0_g1_i1.p1 TRINITY_DN40685_c0_g1~~TRINITY_DN40685_c0_g1_i1.p1  ORF type:complete len:858 (-),score=188.78 TRINITY_DN40685_c0_g1_i1:226-2799(-)
MGPEDLRRQQQSAGYKELLPIRSHLPVHKEKTRIVQAMHDGRVLLILGATGCGKTTQVPQFLLEDLASRGEPCKILATQPRRISAVSVAERVAAERGEELGQTVAYKIRFKDTVNPDTQLIFCTVGILLKVMQGNEDLEGATHLIVDEVHERDLHTDFLLVLVRRILERRPSLKVVLMSATVDPTAFQEYFPDAETFEIPGKTNYPIDELCLEHLFKAQPSLMSYVRPPPRQKWSATGVGGSEAYKLDVPTDAAIIARELQCTQKVAEAIANLHGHPAENIEYGLIQGVVEWLHSKGQEGAVLIFVPGWFEIIETKKALENSSIGRDLVIFPLHSRIPTAEQRLIFSKPPAGKRKVIVSTVLAETSITVEDVVYVIDSGRNKSTFFNESSLISALKTTWYSKANGLQRRGRAGRCRPGAWYRLYSTLQWDAMLDYELPEMLRSPLEELCLEVASLKLGPPIEFLEEAIAPPKAEVATYAVKLLHDLGAVTDESGATLTPLGWKLSRLAVHPQLGKMLLLGGLFRCFEPIMTICASLGYKSPFICPMGKEKEANAAKKRLAHGTHSDHFALVVAYEGWMKSKWSFASANFLSGQTMDYIQRLRRDLTEAVRDIIKQVPADHADEAYRADVCRSVLVAGLWPKVAWIGRRDKADLMSGLKAKVHPGSVNAKEHNLANNVCVYYDIQETTDRWLYDTSIVEMVPLLLFAPSLEELKREGSKALLSLGSWRVTVDAAAADELLALREALTRFIDASVGQPPSAVHASATDALARIFSEHAPLAWNEDDEEDEETGSLGGEDVVVVEDDESVEQTSTRKVHLPSKRAAADAAKDSWEDEEEEEAPAAQGRIPAWKGTRRWGR